MYPLKAIFIGTNKEVSAQARRELLNCSAQLEAEFTNVGDATNALRRASPEKRLLILHMASCQDFEALSRLVAHFPDWPIVTLVEGFDPKASLGEVVVNVMRAGASQILSVPVQAEDFRAALDHITVRFVYSARETKVIAVAGATGGSGATTIALNLAYEIADRHGLRCILVDLSVRMGVIASHLNIEPNHSIFDLLKNIRRVDTYLVRQVLIKVADNLEILAGPPKLSPPLATTSQDIARLVDTLKQIADVVVLDVPCTYDNIYFDTLASAGQAILIGEQKLPSIRALKMVREAIDRVAGTEHIVINQFDPKNKGFSVERLCRPLEVSTIHPVARDDIGMGTAMESARTLRLAAPRSPALADIVALADAVLAIDNSARIKPAGFLGMLGRAFANS